LFEDRFQAIHDFGVRLDVVEFRTLSAKVNSSMILNFTEEKIREAVWQCEG